VISYRGFMLWPDGRIEEVDGDGETYDYDPEPGLFDDLVTAGYPLHRDDRIGRWDGILDLRVDGSTVIAHTSGPESREHDMGAASELFLSWFRKAAEQ
jgi:hypothetical protein